MSSSISFAYPRAGTIGISCALALACGTSSSRPSVGSKTSGGLVTRHSEGSAFPDESFRQEQPPGGTPRDFQLPSITPFQVGPIPIYLVENHDLPTISLELRIDGGRLLDSRRTFGRAGVCMAMMTEGTKRLDKIAYKEALADTASAIFSHATNTTHVVGLRTLTKHFDATLALFHETLTQPGFRKEDLDRLISRQLEDIAQAKRSPESLAERLSASILYGPDHPLGGFATEASLSGISPKVCQSFHAQHLRPNGARLFVVGDMTRQEVIDKFTPLLATWRGKTPPLKAIAKPAPRRGKVFFVNIPGAQQSSIWLGHIGPRRTDPDYFSTELAGRAFGGGFSGRLNMNLREDKGYTYGASGGFDYNRYFGMFAARSQVRSDTTRASIDEILRETRDVVGTTPVAESELQREKSAATLALPSRFATAQSTLGQFANLVLYGLPLDYYTNYVANMSRVTLPDAIAAAKKHIRPEDLQIFVVGDAQATQITRRDGEDVPLLDAQEKPVVLLEAIAELAKQEKGDVVILDADGKILETR